MQKPRDITRLRHWCIRRRGEGVTVNEICTAAQISRRTFYDWWTRYRKHGLEGLQPKSRRPHTIERTPNRTVEEIIAIRKKTAWCPHKIAGYLRTQGRPVGHMTVYRTLPRLRPQPCPNQARNQTNLPTLAENTLQQPLAMRPETRSPKLAHNHPRRPQPVRHSQPHIQRR